MIDEALFWSLGGPSSFVRYVVETANRTGYVAVQLPDYHPPGLVGAVVAGLEEAGVAPVHHVAGQARGSAVHRMATAAGVAGASMRSVGAFFDVPALRGSAFLVDGVRRADWAVWAPFFRSFVAERRRRRDGILLPSLVAVIPPETPRGDVERLFPGAIVPWRDRVSSFDIRTYVNSRVGRTRGSDLVEAAATEVAIALAGYDPVLAHVLSAVEPEAAIDPWELLRRQYASAPGAHPHWGNGLVDHVDGQVFVHTAALVAANDRRAFDVRRWRAVSGPVLDFNGMACRHFADAYADVIAARLPYEVQTPIGPKRIEHRYGLENRHLRDLLAGTLSHADDNFLKAAAKARNDVAHNNVPDPSLVSRLAKAWPAYATRVPSEARGWFWPRCGQRLAVMVGPSGGGKSRYAREHFPTEEIVCTDDIRMELFGSLDTPGKQAEVHETAAARVVERLSRGDGAVMDATNILRRDRLRVVNLVPPDIEVVYVVVDRPMDTKRADGGWRNDRPGLLEGHAETFAAELEAILAGDGQTNVKVLDTRENRKQT